MSAAAGIERARLSVLLDVRSPHSYLALHPALQLARELDVQVNWLPLRVPPLKPPSEPAVDDDRGLRHRRSRARAIAREIETYAQAQGLVLRDPYRDAEPSALNLAWLWLRARPAGELEAFLSEAFRAYWGRELDAASESQVAAMLDALGADGAAFRAWCGGEGPATAAALAEELRERGLTGVPCYVVDDEVFLGRQHLPMIRWILQGCAGPGPI